MEIPPDGSSERDAFFVEADHVVDVLIKQARSKVRYGVELPWSRRREEAVLGAQMTLHAWEKALERLRPFRREVLTYVSQVLRAREAVIGRRGAALWGNSRGSGLLGLAIAALALSSVWTALKTWFTLPGWGALLGFFVTVGALVCIGIPAILGVHRQGHLLYYADLLDAAVKLKERELLQDAPVDTRPADPSAEL